LTEADGAALQTYEGSGFEDEYHRAANSRRSGAEYGVKLTPSRRRTWQVTELQLILVAINSDDERFEIMAQVDPIAGVRIPFSPERTMDTRSKE
jgi:hypothetical protein